MSSPDLSRRLGTGGLSFDHGTCGKRELSCSFNEVHQDPAQSRDRVVVANPHRDANRLSWPPLRSDVVAVACLGVLVYCLVERRWAILALIGLLFAGLSPRMKGQFGFQGGGARLGGELTIRLRTSSRLILARRRSLILLRDLLPKKDLSRIDSQSPPLLVHFDHAVVV